MFVGTERLPQGLECVATESVYYLCVCVHMRMAGNRIFDIDGNVARNAEKSDCIQNCILILRASSKPTRAQPRAISTARRRAD